LTRLQRNGFKVMLYQQVMRFGKWLGRLPNKLVPPPFRVMQLGSAFWQSRALYVAAELGVADVIGDEQKSSQQIAEDLNLHADYLYRLLRMLASIGVFEESAEKFFRNNRLSNCLRKDHPQSVRDMVLLHNSPEMSRPWFESLGFAIRSGDVPFVHSHGEELFDYLDHHPEFDELFTGAMESVQVLTGVDYLDDFDWSRFDRLIDVGGSNGKKTIAILKRYPNLEAIVFDGPKVIEKAADYWRGKEDELLARVSFCGGDMLDSVPDAQSSRDIYLFIAIFHALSDSQAAQVLENLHSACGSHRPIVAIIGTVAEEQNIDPSVASFDMQMLIGTRGRERTESEWRRMLVNGGFKLQEMVNLRTFARLLVVEVS
jgi:hypothetical protein